MNYSTKIQLLTEVKGVAESLAYKDYTTLTNIRDRLSMLIEKIFGSSSSYTEKLKKIKLSPSVVYSGISENTYINSHELGKSSLISLINTMLEDVQLTDSYSQDEATKINSEERVQNNKIFIVHGHNEEMKQAVARIVERLDLRPIILHEQASKGRTIIEKFSDHSDAQFAIVLLSADDVGYSINNRPENAKLRARQNVIFELGFFIGKLGRQRVLALVQENDNFEFPSDYDGVVFIPFDKLEAWKYQLIKELKANNYDIDANKII